MSRKTRQIDYDLEILKIDEHIAELKAKRLSLLRDKTEAENRQILALVREKKLSVEEVSELVNSFKRPESAEADGSGDETEVKRLADEIQNNNDTKGEVKNET